MLATGPARGPRALLSLAALALLLGACGDAAPVDAAAARASAEPPAAASDARTSRDDAGTPAAPARARVALLTQSAGYEHAVVRRAEPDEPSLVERVLAERWGAAHDVALLRDAAELTPARLAQLDVLVMYTTGELPVPDGARTLVDWVRGGGALLGVHSVSDTFHDQPAFLDLLGGEFAGHPWHEEVRVLVVDDAHPATAHLGEGFTLVDEIYEYTRAPVEGRHVLLRLDPESVDLARARRANTGHPLSWVREPGDGRVFHTGLGHEADVWADADFLAHLDGGLRWLLRREEPAGD